MLIGLLLEYLESVEYYAEFLIICLNRRLSQDYQFLISSISHHGTFHQIVDQLKLFHQMMQFSHFSPFMTGRLNCIFMQDQWQGP